MATTNVSELSETEIMLEGMILASDEIAAQLVISRDQWSTVDVELARLIDLLRVQFVAFSAAAKVGRVGDHLSLRTIGRAYIQIVTSLHELATETEGNPGHARECVAQATLLTSRVTDMVECAR